MTLNPYAQSNLYGQYSWFAWGRFYEIYGYSPCFIGDGWDCVDQLIATHIDNGKNLIPGKLAAMEFPSDCHSNGRCTLTGG